MDNNNLGKKLIEIGHSMKNLKFRNSLGLMPLSEVGVLFTIRKLSQKGNVSVSDIAQYLEKSVPAISRTLKTLEEKGSVERITNKNDRRNTYVVITDTGMASIQQNIDSMTDFINKSLSHMSEEEAVQFVELLDKFYGCIRQEIEQKGRNQE